MSRLQNFLDSRLTDGCDVVSLTRRPHFTSRKIPGIHFCQRLSQLQGHCAAGRIGTTGEFSDFVGKQVRDLPACSIAPGILVCNVTLLDRLCGLVDRVPAYISRGPGSIPGTTRLSEK
jgi:hypothetical protein